MGKKFVFGKDVICGEVCPDCGSKNQHTIDSRIVGGQRIRRRQCLDCLCKWNTIEIFYNYVKGV